MAFLKRQHSLFHIDWESKSYENLATAVLIAAASLFLSLYVKYSQPLSYRMKIIYWQILKIT
jgi:hypothetical protein